MKSPAAVRKEVTNHLLGRLAPRGFVRSGLFLLRGRDAGIHDWISFPSTVPAKNGPVAISANVGIYVEPLHRLLERPVGATFCTNIGYVSPHKTWTEWLFDRDSFSTAEAEGLSGAIITYGLPFMEGFRTLHDTISGCERYGLPYLNATRLPVLRSLAAGRDREKA